MSRRWAASGRYRDRQLPFFEKTSAASGSDFSAFSIWSCICVGWSIEAEGTRKFVTVMSFLVELRHEFLAEQAEAGIAAAKMPTPPAMNSSGRATACRSRVHISP